MTGKHQGKVKAAKAEKTRPLPSDELATTSPPTAAVSLLLSGKPVVLPDPETLAAEALQLYVDVREGRMDSSEAGRLANLLQITNNLRASHVHRTIRELVKRLEAAGVLPRTIEHEQ